MSLKKYFTYLFLSLNITISYFILGNETNGLLVFLIGLSPLMFWVVNRKLDSIDIIFFLLLFLMFANAYFHPGFRVISYMYSLCFVFSFLSMKKAFVNGMFPEKRIQRILRNVLYAYAIVLVLQQLCVIVGIRPINQTFGFENKWKLPSLAQEPSHMAIFVFFFMYSYMLISEKIMGHKYGRKDAKKEKWVWIAYFWCMLTCQSTSAILYCGLLFLRYVKAKTIIKYTFVLIFVIIAGSLIFYNSEAFHRAFLFSEAFLTLNIDAIDEADHSAAYRFFPMFYLLQNMNVFSTEFWFGHGLDFGKNALNLYALDISGDETYDGHVNMGGFFGYILDYGFLCFGILCLAIKKQFKGIHEPWLIVFYIWINMFVGFNMQLFWSSTVLITYLSISKYKCKFQSRSNIKSNNKV